ncbi:tryptophan synthase subunit alpha [Sanguibacter sp. A247]|uniref:tryptophan synthase subunit alpha n=1 Tax=unclassified Sanguibacter TaxID=2645534 RepID=UPI003FD78E40
MSATATRISALRDEGRAALVGYLPVGLPDAAGTIRAARALVEAGADILEIGVPYSDPVMDGGTIQAAVTRALDSGVRLTDVFRVVEGLSDLDVPVLVMTYFNPVLRYGVERFAADLAGAGGAGLITPDLIPDEAEEWVSAADEHGLDKVFLVAPSSTDARLVSTSAASRGFVYAASTMGVTGERASVGPRAEELVTRTRAAGAVNVCVGLGVSTATQAAEVGRYADGVIVGSAFVRPLLEAPSMGDGVSQMAEVARALAGGVRTARTGDAA